MVSQTKGHEKSSPSQNTYNVIPNLDVFVSHFIYRFVKTI